MKSKPTSFSDLQGVYSERYLSLLKWMVDQYHLSFQDIYMKLPEADLVKRDEEFIESCPVARVLMKVADPATHVLTYFYLTGSIPEDYPEQPKYYISTSEGSVDAPFTKTEFLESVKKEQKVKPESRKK